MIVIADTSPTDLDDGERDAILLAQGLSADELIMDDMEGRREAERPHIHFVGTLGFRHPELGLVRLDRNVALYAWHGRQHVTYITSLRERMRW
jgi:predicted nucleic acid-binding protein